jgi:glucose-6-phosphate isomerase
VQLIHQGRTIPCDFIGFCESQEPLQLPGEPVSNHDELMSNFFAQVKQPRSSLIYITNLSLCGEKTLPPLLQPDALAVGKTEAELTAEAVKAELIPHKVFEGNRPSLSLLLPRLDAYTVGQLLALYEHRTAVQGFVWGICSFDQWGVELGKALATSVRGALKACRSDGHGEAVSPLSSFNPSTASLIDRYVKHVDPRY